MRSERNDLERLEQELQGSAYQALLRKLQRKYLFFRRFSTWADVIAFMRNGTSTDPRKDEVLRPIFEAHGEDEDPRWRAVLLAIFWPGLESIHFQKRGWDPDPEERWQNITWTFLQVLCRVDVKRRPERLVQKVFNDTVHHLHDEYRRAWNRTNREFTAEPEEIDALAGGVEGIDFAGIELREKQEIEINRLREHLEAGRITEADFLLLIGTRVYGKSVADYAREAGLDYQVAKKRRQRAEAVIRRFEEEKR
ncbi:MAG: hypothetical protein Fur0037_02670 [Planctomycetota bacterium]